MRVSVKEVLRRGKAYSIQTLPDHILAGFRIAHVVDDQRLRNAIIH
jgi:hypothetical protein